MSSLVIVIIAIALAVVLALAALVYGGPAWRESVANTKATTAISQSAQILGAAELYRTDKDRWSTGMTDLVDKRYLLEIPSLEAGANVAVAWAQPKAGVPTYWALRSASADVCKRINLRARGDNGIYNKARPGLVTQCFGKEAPYTVVTTRQGLGEEGLDVVFEFANEPGVEYGVDGGGWSLEPTESRHGEGPGPNPGTKTDTGTPDGRYLDDQVKVTLPGKGDVGSNVLPVGTIPNGGKVTEEIRFTNTGSEPWNVDRVRTCAGDFKIVGSTCSGTVPPGGSCSVIVEGGPYPEVTEPRDLSGCVALDTNKGTAEVGVGGKVVPAPKGPLQVGIGSEDPRDTATELIFPDTVVGQTSYKWVTIQNVGEGFTFGSPRVLVSPPFSVVQDECGASLPYGAKCSVRLAFSPTAATVYSGANFTFQVNASNQYRDVLVTGKGLPAPVAGVTLSPTELAWGEHAATGQYPMTVSVKNHGDTNLKFTAMPAISEGQEGFRVSATTCPQTLNASLTCTITVQFNPDEARKFTGKLSMTFEGLGLREVPLDGTATNPLKAKSLTLANATERTAYSSADLGDGFELTTGAPLTKSQLDLQLASGATLPDGLTLDATTRKVTGTPTTAMGTAQSFKIRAVYQTKYTGEQTFSILVNENQLDIRRMFAGVSHSCAMTVIGGLWCWGNDGVNGAKNTPTQMAALTSGVTDVGLSWKHSCVVKSGTVYCWGVNDYGNLGTNNVNASFTSTTPLAVGVPGGAVKVTSGANHSCAISTSGNVYCWGMGNKGAIGDNNGSLNRWAPSAVQLAVTPLTYLSGATQVSGGQYHSCAVVADTQVYCWGTMDGSALHRAVLRWDISGSGVTIKRLASGSDHVCALTSAGDVYCSGVNSVGQLGDGTTTTRGGFVKANITGATDIAAGPLSTHTCAAGAGGVAYCWGTGANGRLGDGSSVNKSTPTATLALGAATKTLALRQTSTCANLANGTIKCWGNNPFGTGDVYTPTELKLPQ